ncbi:ABC transporter ATP-binding protein [bacterium]|nr:ABC transporter ATP-binding protein [bacterium]
MDKDKSLTVLKGIDLELMQGEIVAVIGHSGAGKSTLLHIMGALDKPSEGEIIINGDAIYDMSKEQLARFRNKTIGFIFQFHYLLPEFNAIENVMMPGLIAGENKKTLYPKAESLLLKVGLKERLRHRPSELSGGEQQRVAFARALVNDPLLILADEPSGNLDSKNSQALHELIWEVVGDKQTTFVVVTHDRKLSNRADRSIILRDGLICENDELI